MPQYFFHMTNGDTVQDVDGESFALASEARDHALRVAQELSRNGSSLIGKSISVMDEKGVVVFTTPLTDED